MAPVQKLEDTRVPPLAPGDRLTRAEFERRSALVPEQVKVELLDGEVYMSAATSVHHSGPHSLLDAWLAGYSYATTGVEAHSNPTLKLDEFSQPQPDALLRIVTEAGGLSRIEGGFCQGPVELVAEVAASSVAIDLNRKKDIYLRNAIREYLVYVVADARIAWFALDGGRYMELGADRRGIVRSSILPGLWLDTRAFAAGDGAKVLAVLQRGLASKGHQAFTRELAKRLRAGRRRKKR